jgi:hypothetical protein
MRATAFGPIAAMSRERRSAYSVWEIEGGVIIVFIIK